MRNKSIENQKVKVGGFLENSIINIHHSFLRGKRHPDIFYYDFNLLMPWLWENLVKQRGTGKQIKCTIHREH